MGESFSEIFFGNSVVIGHALRDRVARRHGTACRGSSKPRRRQRCRWISGSALSPAVARPSPSASPAAARGSRSSKARWDATGMLLDRYEGRGGGGQLVAHERRAGGDAGEQS